MTYIILISGIIILVLLISLFKFNTFLAFVIVALLLGLANQMPIVTWVTSIEKGIGSILGSLLIIICFGAMQGKIVVYSGAAQRITDHLVSTFGIKYLQLALLITGLIVGIPLFYGVGFVLLVPLVINLSVQEKLPAVWLGLPMLAVLSALHGFLPPHPSPVALTQILGGELGKTLIVGSVVAIVAVLFAGLFFSRFVKTITNTPIKAFVTERKTVDELPGLFSSYFACFLPILLIGAGSLVKGFLQEGENHVLTTFLMGIGNPIVAMTISLLFCVFILGTQVKQPLVASMKMLETAVSEIAPILLVIAGAGAFNQVLTDCGLTTQLSKDLSSLHASPLVLGFLVATIIRVATGSATIAGLTAIGIIKPLFIASHIAPELMVLAVGAGSLMFSHVNDAGFWMFKEYFNLDMKQTFKTWTLMESLLGLTGLLMVLFIHAVFY